MSQKRVYSAGWTCAKCTFIHEKQDEQFLSCTMCGELRQQEAGEEAAKRQKTGDSAPAPVPLAPPADRRKKLLVLWYYDGSGPRLAHFIDLPADKLEWLRNYVQDPVDVGSDDEELLDELIREYGDFTDDQAVENVDCEFLSQVP